MQAPLDGLWYPRVTIDQMVCKGQLLGRLESLRGEVLEEVRAKFDGVVLYHTTALEVKAKAAERFGMFTFARLVAGLGAGALGIHNICGGLCDIYYSFSQGLGKAALVQTGEAFCSKNKEKMRRISAVAKKAALSTGALASLLYYIFSIPLLKFYHLQGNYLLLGSHIMLFVALINIPEAWAMIHAGMLRVRGRTAYVAAYSLISIAIVRPILTYLLIYPLHLGLYGAWLALSIDQTSRALCSWLGERR